MKLKIFSLIIALSFCSVHAQIRNSETTQSLALTQGGVTAANHRGITGRGSTIGIIDQGFDLTHSDIRTQVQTSMNLFQSGPITWGTHGTAMASIACGKENQSGTLGVAPGCKLLLAQVGIGGSNLYMDQRAIKLALDWLSSQRATVINMSFGGSYTPTFIQSVQYQPTTKSYIGMPIANSIADYKIASDRGSILVMAAGNQGLPFAQYPALYAVQTDYSGKLILGGRALIVGAVDSTNQITNYSNRAGHLCIQSVGTTCKDTVQSMDYFVVAPGNLQAATANQLGRGTNTASTVTGTSGAAAYVSGGIALMRQAWPTLRPEHLVDLVRFTARDLGTKGLDNTYGRGLVDFDAATRPTGQLVISNNTYRLGTTQLPTTTLSSTGIGGGIVLGIGSNSVLSRTQVIDEIGRNYTADLTKSQWRRSPVYDLANPYLAFTGYQPVRFSLDNADLAVHVSPTGSAVDYVAKFNNFSLGYQFGNMRESQGFVGNMGSGTLDLGSSTTTWNQLALELNLAKNYIMRLAYAQGRTDVINSPMSMITVLGPVLTHTAQVGIVRRNFMAENDRLQIGLGYEPMIRRGLARVTAVTDYSYRELEDGSIIGDPEITSEIISLRHKNSAIMSLSYQTRIGTQSLVSGSVAGNQFGYKLGVNFTWLQ